MQLVLCLGSTHLFHALLANDGRVRVVAKPPCKPERNSGFRVQLGYGGLAHAVLSPQFRPTVFRRNSGCVTKGAALFGLSSNEPDEIRRYRQVHSSN